MDTDITATFGNSSSDATRITTNITQINGSTYQAVVESFNVLLPSDGGEHDCLSTFQPVDSTPFVLPSNTSMETHTLEITGEHKQK